jgi:hypothetical protein
MEMSDPKKEFYRYESNATFPIKALQVDDKHLEIIVLNEKVLKENS